MADVRDPFFQYFLFWARLRQILRRAPSKRESSVAGEKSICDVVESAVLDIAARAFSQLCQAQATVIQNPLTSHGILEMIGKSTLFREHAYDQAPLELAEIR